MKLSQKNLSTTQIIALGFFCAIIIGTLLLLLPAASANGNMTSPVDALFTATTSVCVTGLVSVPTYLHWSLFGQIVILILIQLGGLGIISFTTGIMMVIGRKITLRDRLLLEDALNLNTLSGLVAFLRKIFRRTFIVEGIGAACYAFVFIPKYGISCGVWYSVFHSISAFCNAGIDLLGDSITFNEENAKQQAVFTITNTGNAPLIIVRVNASCGCTTPKYTKAPIMPGKSGKIIIDYNGTNRAIGPFNKTILVKTNASKEQIRLLIKGNMQPGVAPPNRKQ